MAKISVYYQLFLHDEHGKLVWKSRKRLSKSFVLQWLQIIFAQLNQTSVANVRNTSNALKTVTPNSMNLDMDAAVGIIAEGLVVGSGTTAESNTDYALATQITHGTGAGQLQYGSSGWVNPTVVAGNVDGVASRTFLNGSGATVTVREIGGYQRGYAAGTEYFCGLRDVLPSPVDVPNAQTLTVQYTLRTTV